MNKHTNPLHHLIGTWKGNKGLDLAPKPDIDEENPFYEVLEIAPVDIEIENASEQELRTVKYTTYIKEIATDEVSHSETGYWIWDKDQGTIMCAFSIPRGVCVLAGGAYTHSNDAHIFEVAAAAQDAEWGIIESPFMAKKATTKSFKRTFTVHNNTLTYTQTTALAIYNKSFDHVDTNTLNKQP